MDKKIFFFDLDGTLLNDEKKISDKTFEALKRFTDAGNLFAINTGRALESAKNVQKELGLNFKGAFLVCFNGAQIYDCDNDKMIRRDTIDLSIVKEIFDLANKFGIHAHTYTDDYIISPADDKELAFYRKAIKTPAKIVGDVPSFLTKAPSKCIAIELEDLEKLERFRLEAKKIAPDKLSIMYSHPSYLELFPITAGKGSAVKSLCEYLGIPIENSMAAGDEQNDISMIKAAGLGIAMKNAIDAVKKEANVITENDNNHDGLVPYLKV